MTAGGSSSAVGVPSLGTLHRAVQRDLRAGRVLEVARPSRNRIEASRYDRVLADLKLQRAGEGLPVVDAEPASAPGPGTVGEEDAAPLRGGQQFPHALGRRRNPGPRGWNGWTIRSDGSPFELRLSAAG
ncbi:hypothetical protein PL81_31715 [Streptomyces sp. RSD-27]|nr:hypothetical protein PL81_31715 [Streptomyces sp. RSD-27]